MALRRASLARSCLNRHSAPSFAEHLHISLAATSRSLQRRCYSFRSEPDSELSPQLSRLLGAIQSRDFASISSSFFQWTDALAVDAPTFDLFVADELRELPRNTISEIVRNLDPIAHPELDVAHGLRLTLGQTQYMDLDSLADEFGLRPHHRRVLRGMQTLLQAIGGPAESGLRTPDLETMIRCAGTVQDSTAAINLFGDAARLEGYAGRTTRTVLEFIKARFLLDPVYHQYEPTRIILQARDLLRKDTKTPIRVIEKMDRLRLSENALLREPWNRHEDNLARRVQRNLRRRTLSPHAFRVNYARLKGEGAEDNEEIMCTSMLGFARTNAVNEIVIKIFAERYGIYVTNESKGDLMQPGRRVSQYREKDIEIYGCRVFPQGHPLKPTQRLVNATIDAFGSMGHISLGLRIVDHLSLKYDIPLTHEMWSKILNWTYVHASGPTAGMRQALGDRQAYLRLSAEHSLQIISMMTSEPYNITLSFDDNLIYAKALIITGDIDEALNVLRHQLVPHYETLANDHRHAIADEILRAAAAPSSPLAHKNRRRRAQILLDHAWHRIGHVVNRLIKQIGTYEPLVADPDKQNLIPDIVAEFRDFMDRRITYRTDQGLVELWRPPEDIVFPRATFHMQGRQMLPATPSGWRALSIEQRLEKLLEEIESIEQALTNPTTMATVESDGQHSLYGELSDELVSVEEKVAYLAEYGAFWSDFHKPPEERQEPPPIEGAWWSDFELKMTERRIVMQFTRIPVKRAEDLTAPGEGAEDQEVFKWRRKVAREFLL